MWVTTKIPTICRSALLDLADNRIPAVRLEGFATPTQTHNFLSALLTRACRTSSIEQVTRLGISQYEQGLCASKDNYFALAQRFSAEFADIFAASFSPLQRLIDQLGAAGFDADIMSEPGFGRYFAGNGKLRNGFSPIHVDFAPQDSGGWAVAEAGAQLAWNFYLRIPKQGGELLLWDKLWSPPDDQYQVVDSYYYQEDVVRGTPMVRVPVRPGEVIFINSRNFHAVAQAEDRLAYGSFISVFERRRLRLWS